MNNYFLKSTLLFSFILIAKNPKTIIIAFDLDDTLIEYNRTYKIKVAVQGISLQDPIGSFRYLKSLNNMRKNIGIKTKIPNSKIHYNKIIGGGYLLLAYAGMQDIELRPYVPGLIDLIWNNSNFKQGIPDLLTYLYKKGYELWIATNKDHISYEDVLNSIAKRSGFDPRLLITRAFVTWPTTETIESLYTLEPREKSEFQGILDRIKKIQPTEKIIHMHQPKPLESYYETLLQYSNTKKIVFFDDKTENIQAAKQYGIAGFSIKNCTDIINRLINLKILDPVIDDKEFCDTFNQKNALTRILFWTH